MHTCSDCISKKTSQVSVRVHLAVGPFPFFNHWRSIVGSLVWMLFFGCSFLNTRRWGQGDKTWNVECLVCSSFTHLLFLTLYRIELFSFSEEANFATPQQGDPSTQQTEGGGNSIPCFSACLGSLLLFATFRSKSMPWLESTPIPCPNLNNATLRAAICFLDCLLIFGACRNCRWKGKRNIEYGYFWP